MIIDRFTDKGTSHYAEIAQWFNKNATEYFDSVEASEDGLSISFMLDGIAVMTLSRSATGSSLTAVFNTKLGATQTSKIATTSVVTYIYKLVKFSTGIGIFLNSQTSTYNPCTIFITKNDKDKLGLVWSSNLYSTSGVYYMMSFETTNAFNTNLTTNSTMSTGASGATSLAPICCYMVDDYFPNLFIQAQNALKTQECYFTMNDVEYYSNGYLAIKV